MLIMNSPLKVIVFHKTTIGALIQLIDIDEVIVHQVDVCCKETVVHESVFTVSIRTSFWLHHARHKYIIGNIRRKCFIIHTLLDKKTIGKEYLPYI